MAIEYERALQANSNIRPSSFMFKLDRLFAKWQKVPESLQHPVVIKELPDPLQPICRTYITMPNAFLILNLINECKHAWENILALKAFVKDNMNFKATKLKKIEENFHSFLLENQ